MVEGNEQGGTQGRVPSDEDLVLQAQQGSLEAFTQLYERYLPMVYVRVRYRVPETDVEDVTQEIFMTVMRSLRSFKGNARFSTWLRTLISRRIADYYRGRDPAETELGVDISEVDEALLGISEEPQRASLDDMIGLRRALGELPEMYREVLFLRFVDGLQFNEIARERGQSIEAAKSLFRRAIAALRKQVEQPNAQ
jgi:RNA polymerase sigma-70 factor (ECF subfamily)